MKNIYRVKLLLLLLVVFAGSCFAQTDKKDDQKAINIVKKFYVAYITTWNMPIGGIAKKKKLDSLLTLYCTPECRKGVYSHLLDNDYMLNDLLPDTKHINTVTVTKDVSRAGTFDVTYIAQNIAPGGGVPTDKKNTMYVTMAVYNNALKIATVKSK